MKFTIKTASAEELRTGALVLAAFSEALFPPALKRADEATQGKLAKILARGDLGTKAGSTLVLHDLDNISAERIILVSLGKQDEFGDRAWRKAITSVGKKLAALPATDAAVAFIEPEALPPGRDLVWGLSQAALLIADAGYRFDAPGAKPEKDRKGVKNLVFILDAVTAPLKAAVAQGQATAKGIRLTKDLANLGANVCTPSYLAETALKLSEQYKFDAKVLNEHDIEKLGMGAFLAVARGAKEPPRFIVLHYQGKGAAKKKHAPIVLIGKGITFDSGGISLKPGAEMDEMKYDMSGAASVLGTLQAVAELALPINLVGIIPATENMPDGKATRPGDVVRSLSGQTIEILNTDAEGRLILCDALTYAERFEPAAVIDIATLTGACIIALGKIAAAVLGNDDALATELSESGAFSGDRVWQLPLWDEYHDALKSNFADVANVGGRPGGTITAAAFLSRFAKAYKWAHIDIAGVAWVSGEAKGSTGRPVPLLTEFLIRRARYRSSQ